MSRSPFRLPIVLGSLAAFAATAFAAGSSSPASKISPDLANSSSRTAQPVIIQYYNPPSPVETGLLGLVGGLLKTVLGSINAVVANVLPSQLNLLAADPNVKYISLDRPLGARGAGNITTAEFTTEPINAPAVWQLGYKGSNIGVAVIDSGITPVPDLALNPGLPSLSSVTNLLASLTEVAPGATGRIVYSQNFVANEKDALDHYGHGTHVAGLIAGNGAQSAGSGYFRTFTGSAPNASLINLRVLDENGAGSDSAVIAAIEQAIALKGKYNIRVINLSLGRPVYESYALDPLCQAVERAWKAGIVVVVAAGNDGRNLNLNSEGYGTIDAPGNDPYALTVGAMNTMETASIQDDVIASYSSKGPSFIDHVVKPDVVAPGNLVTSLQYSQDSLAVNNPSFYTWYSFYRRNGAEAPSPSYFPLSGTSMATGVTSGAVADLLQAAPQLTPDQVKALVMVNADRKYFPVSSSVTAEGVIYNANYDVFTIGAGYLDIAKTVSAAMAEGQPVPAGTAMSPIAIYNDGTGNTTAVIDPSALWTSTGLWSATNVYGSRAFITTGNSNNAVWGSTALWGKTDPDGYTALWGRTALWGKGTPAAETALWGKDTTEGQTALWGRSDPGDTNVSVQY
jgi:serine protease AprX